MTEAAWRENIENARAAPDGPKGIETPDGGAATPLQKWSLMFPGCCAWPDRLRMNLPDQNGSGWIGGWR
jgi:hypothetical protein